MKNNQERLGGWHSMCTAYRIAQCIMCTQKLHGITAWPNNHQTIFPSCAELKVLKPWRWPVSSNADSQCLLWCQHLPTLPLWHENQISRKDKQGWVVDPIYLCTTSRGFAFLQWLWIDKINETWAATAVRTHRPATNIGLDASQQGERVPPTGTKKPKEWHAPHVTSSNLNGTLATRVLPITGGPWCRLQVCRKIP